LTDKSFAQVVVKEETVAQLDDGPCMEADRQFKDKE
jgi:hypothetical protein